MGDFRSPRDVGYQEIKDSVENTCEQFMEQIQSMQTSLSTMASTVQTQLKGVGMQVQARMAMAERRLADHAQGVAKPEKPCCFGYCPERGAKGIDDISWRIRP